MTGPQDLMRTPRQLLGRVEADARLDQIAGRLKEWGESSVPQRVQQLLGGDWMGHPLHPALTDVTIGFWTSAMVLDLIGGRSSRPAAQRLVALGVWAALPTWCAGFVELIRLQEVALRRVAVVHGVGNAIAEVAYVASWANRRRDQHLRGIAWGLVGGTIASATGYLGGHLAFGDTRTAMLEATDVTEPLDLPETGGPASDAVAVDDAVHA